MRLGALRRVRRSHPGCDPPATELPQRGHAGRWPGTRELIIPGTPDIVPYRVQDELVESCASLTAPAAGRRSGSRRRSQGYPLHISCEPWLSGLWTARKSSAGPLALVLAAT
jgi:hypothetical protein